MIISMYVKMKAKNEAKNAYCETECSEWIISPYDCLNNMHA